jgi:hypothetical protein
VVGFGRSRDWMTSVAPHGETDVTNTLTRFYPARNFNQDDIDGLELPR